MYYIDHNTQSTYMDPPWDKRVKEHYKALREHLFAEEQRLSQQKVLQEEKRKQLQAANDRVANLERKKTKLETDLQQEKDKSRSSLVETKLDEVKVQLEQERSEADRIAEEHQKLQAEIEEFQQRLEELRSLNERLTAENQSQLEAAKQTNRELLQVKELMEVEASQRSALESYVMQLKEDILAIAKEKKKEKTKSVAPIQEVAAPVIQEPAVEEKPQESVAEEPRALEQRSQELVQESAESMEVEKKAEIEAVYTVPPPAVEDDEGPAPIPQSNLSNSKNMDSRISMASSAGGTKRRTMVDNRKKLQLDMEMELLALKKRLQAEQRERLRLEKMSKKIEEVKEKVSAAPQQEVSAAVPDWIKKLNVYASKSKTLRIKIGKQAKQNPDDLSFT